MRILLAWPKLTQYLSWYIYNHVIAYSDNTNQSYSYFDLYADIAPNEKKGSDS